VVEGETTQQWTKNNDNINGNNNNNTNYQNTTIKQFTGEVRGRRWRQQATDDNSDDVYEGQHLGDKGGGTHNDRQTKEEARTTTQQMMMTTTVTKQHDNQIVHRREGGRGWVVVARRKWRDVRWCWGGARHRINLVVVLPIEFLCRMH
jgi:hypothetical protein